MVTSHPGRVLVGMPVHPESARHLAVNLEYWQSERGDVAEVVVVPNCGWPAELRVELDELARRYPFAAFRRELIGAAHPGPWGNLLAAQRLLWDLAIERGCSHLLFHEVTRVPPPGALGRLLACRLPVVGTLYKCAHSFGSYSVFAFDGDTLRHTRPYTLVDWNRRPRRVVGSGFGFTLIAADVLARTTLHCDSQPADSHFCRDAGRLGIPIHVTPLRVDNVKVDHRWPDWLCWWLGRPARIARELWRGGVPFLLNSRGEADEDGIASP